MSKSPTKTKRQPLIRSRMKRHSRKGAIHDQLGRCDPRNTSLRVFVITQRYLCILGSVEHRVCGWWYAPWLVLNRYYANLPKQLHGDNLN